MDLHPDRTGACRWGDVTVCWDRLSVSAVPEALTAARRPGSSILLFRGYVANRRSLTARLGGSQRPDVDLVADAIHRWGPATTAAAIDGPCSWLVWQDDEQSLVACSDRLGIQPLFWTCKPEQVRFGLRAASLACVRGAEDFDLDVVAAHLHLVPVASERTFFRGISAVRPGTLLVIERQRTRQVAWWTPTSRGRGRVPTGDPERLGPALMELLTQVTSEHATETAAGLTLSSGSDSTAVAAAWRRSLPEESHPAALLWSLPDLPECDESPKARRVAIHLGLDPVDVAASRCWPLCSGIGALSTLDRPAALGFVELWDATFRAAADRGIRSILTGAGGDQLFGAGEYFTYAEQILRGGLFPAVSRWQRHRRCAGAGMPPHAWTWLLRPLAAALVPRRRRPLTLPWSTPSLEERLRDAVEPASRWWLPRPATRSRVESLQPSSLAPPMVDLEERGSAYGISGRHPLLDHRLIEWALDLPPELLMLNGRRKGLLRRATGPFLPPPEQVELTKVGLDALFRRGLQQERSAVQEMLEGSRAAQLGWLDGAALRRASRDLGDGNLDPRLRTALTLESWLRRHLG